VRRNLTGGHEATNGGYRGRHGEVGLGGEAWKPSTQAGSLREKVKPSGERLSPGENNLAETEPRQMRKGKRGGWREKKKAWGTSAHLST